MVYAYMQQSSSKPENQHQPNKPDEIIETRPESEVKNEYDFKTTFPDFSKCKVGEKTTEVGNLVEDKTTRKLINVESNGGRKRNICYEIVDQNSSKKKTLTLVLTDH